MARRMISTTVYLTPNQDLRLKQLADSTQVPAARWIRLAVDALLESKGLGEDPFERAQRVGHFDLPDLAQRAAARRGR